MNKAQLIQSILQTNPQMTHKALSKCKKKELDEMYNTLQNHEKNVEEENKQLEKIEKKKTIIEFSSFSDSEEEENNIENSLSQKRDKPSITSRKENEENVSMSVIKVKKNENISSDEELEELPKEPPKLTRQNAMTSSVMFDRIEELQREYNEFYGNDEEELEALPPLQREEPKPKLNIIKIKQQIREEMKIFIDDMKNILHDFRQTNDKNFLADNYNILLRDQEERFFHFLEDLQAPETLYKYADSLLQPHTNRINRLVR